MSLKAKFVTFTTFDSFAVLRGEVVKPPKSGYLL